MPLQTYDIQLKYDYWTASECVPSVLYACIVTYSCRTDEIFQAVLPEELLTDLAFTARYSMVGHVGRYTGFSVLPMSDTRQHT